MVVLLLQKGVGLWLLQARLRRELGRERVHLRIWLRSRNRRRALSPQRQTVRIQTAKIRCALVLRKQRHGGVVGAVVILQKRIFGRNRFRLRLRAMLAGNRLHGGAQASARQTRALKLGRQRGVLSKRRTFAVHGVRRPRSGGHVALTGSIQTVSDEVPIRRRRCELLVWVRLAGLWRRHHGRVVQFILVDIADGAVQLGHANWDLAVEVWSRIEL